MIGLAFTLALVIVPSLLRIVQPDVGGLRVGGTRSHIDRLRGAGGTADPAPKTARGVDEDLPKGGRIESGAELALLQAILAA